MARRRWSTLLAALGVAILLCAPGGSVLATDPIDLDLNPVTGLIEAVAVSAADGDRIRHVEDPGQGEALVDTVVSTEAAADSHIAITAAGETWVVWQDEATAQIRSARRNSSTRVWTAEVTVSLPGEISGHPTLAHSGFGTWVAYEIGVGVGRSIAVTSIEDSPEPFPTRTIVATTASLGALDLTLHAEAGQIWLAWHDLPLALTWSEYDGATGVWTPPQNEMIGLQTVTRTLANIRVKALAP